MVKISKQFKRPLFEPRSVLQIAPPRSAILPQQFRVWPHDESNRGSLEGCIKLKLPD